VDKGKMNLNRAEKAIKRPSNVVRLAPKAPTPAAKAVSIQALIERLHPLFERVKVQSTKHVALISKTELAIIASQGQRLLDEWASGDETVRRVRGHVVPLKTPAEEKEVAHGPSL
jgi:hypothetical protein